MLHQGSADVDAPRGTARDIHITFSAFVHGLAVSSTGLGSQPTLELPPLLCRVAASVNFERFARLEPTLFLSYSNSMLALERRKLHINALRRR